MLLKCILNKCDIANIQRPLVKVVDIANKWCLSREADVQSFDLNRNLSHSHAHLLSDVCLLSCPITRNCCKILVEIQRNSGAARTKLSDNRLERKGAASRVCHNSRHENKALKCSPGIDWVHEQDPHCCFFAVCRHCKKTLHPHTGGVIRPWMHELQITHQIRDSHEKIVRAHTTYPTSYIWIKKNRQASNTDRP